MDLHELIEAKGHKVVAHAMKSSIRRLKEIAKGRTALTVDDLYELDRAFGRLFHLEQTILVLGRLRDVQRRSRKHSPKANPTLMTIWNEE